MLPQAAPPCPAACYLIYSQTRFQTQIQAALEEACAALGYGLDEVAAILRPGGQYPPELLSLVMSKTRCESRLGVGSS